MMQGILPEFVDAPQLLHALDGGLLQAVCLRCTVGRWAASSTACLNGWPAVKRTPRRAAIGAAAPVLGLRPTRACLAWTCHVPKRRRITDSPCRKLAFIVVRMASTAASALAVVHSSSWAMRCTISAFLIVPCSV